MALSVEQFWKLAVESRLFTAGEMAETIKSYAGASGVRSSSVEALVGWLISERRISQYQAKILVAGKAGPFVYGDYRIYDRIESGRLAGIFRALHSDTKHPVCLNFLSGSAYKDPEVLASLTQQAAAANRASLGHPNLLRCYHLADEKAYKFIVVEDLQGKRLERKLATSGALPPAEACRIARQAALGLARLHAMGQAHGEIRPANIWIKPNGQVKLLLFPLYRDPLAPDMREIIAAAANQKKVPPQADYLAPELATGDQLPDARSDIYSLGCTLYHMLANQAPFAGGDFQKKLARHQHEKPVPLDRVNPAIPTALAKLVNYMMAKDPELRYQQANSVVEALLPHLAPGEAETQPAPPSRRSVAYEKWLSKRFGKVPSATPAAAGTPTASAAAPTVPAPHPAKPAATAAGGGEMGAAPMAAVPVAATPAAVAPLAATPIATAPLAATALAATPVAATPYGMPAVAMAVPAGGVAIATAVPATAIPTAAVPMMATPLGAGPAMLAPGYASDLEVGGSEDDLAAARGRRRARQRRNTIVFALLFIVVVGGGAGGSWWYLSKEGFVPPLDQIIANASGTTTTDGPDTTKPNQPPEKPKEEPPPKPDPTQAKGYVWGLADGMWESPTHGEPLDLKYVASGIKALVAIRPADLAKHPEGEKLLDPKVSGALGDWVRQQLPTVSGTTVDNIELALVGVLDSPMGPPRLSLVVHFFQPVEAAAVKQAWPDAAQEKLGDSSFFHKGDDAFFLPAAGNGKILVVAPKTEMRDIVSSDGGAPLLPLQLETMLKTSTDRQRMLTVVSGGDMLSTPGQGLLLGPAAALKGALDWLISGSDPADPMAGSMPSDPPKALLFSCHLDENLFVELRWFDPQAAPDSPQPAEAVRQRLGQVHKKMNRAVLGLSPSEYSKNVVVDLPDQVDSLEKYTRSGVVEKQVVLCAYQPAAAAHNLLLGTYLCLLESSGGGGGVAVATTGPAAATPAGPLTAANALKKKITLSFPRNTLEVAMQLMAEKIGVPITIMGPDLQIDGITKNQSFGLEEKDVPAIDILHKILKQANPDGKLIYVIKPKADGSGEEIFLTTRAAAEKRGDALTPDMVRQAPEKKKK